ncbi:MAG: helix-turn-helix domain-containing protein [Candidatus Omnitrophota bacterium]
MENKTKLYTTEEAAKRLSITRQGLAYLVKEGKIKPVEHIESKYKFFSEEEIYKYLAEK